ncbi:hypothetical protein [Absidia glauca]|uniref:Uncharacterized protein n=1 Tax=Absidia glauca TaxID=4829 RepID=A0A168RCG8_ABSGL|nr:hypothetical protein [Absidia glauca]
MTTTTNERTNERSFSPPLSTLIDYDDHDDDNDDDDDDDDSPTALYHNIRLFLSQCTIFDLISASITTDAFGTVDLLSSPPSSRSLHYISHFMASPAHSLVAFLPPLGHIA